jgi:hypothetical protein
MTDQERIADLIAAATRALVEAADLSHRSLGGGTDLEGDAWNLALRSMDTGTIRHLLDNLPTLAGPWEVRDMRSGNPTRAVRIGWEGRPIAEVRRRGNAWTARVGGTLIESSYEQVHFATCDEAKAACDRQLEADGVRLEGEQ